MNFIVLARDWDWVTFVSVGIPFLLILCAVAYGVDRIKRP